MDYENIIEIIELRDYSEVNKYLKCGWVLLSASVAVGSSPYGVERDRIYSIGWNRKNGEVQYPISECSQDPEIADKQKRLDELMSAMLAGNYDAVAKGLEDMGV